jgi:flagellin-like protein
MKNEMKNEQAVSPVIATILMVAITVVLAGVLYVWANNLAAEGTDTTAQTLNTYSADDANGEAGSGTGDNLIRMQMTGKDTLSWTFVRIQLAVGDTIHKCSVAGGDPCNIDQQGGDNANSWEPGEFIFLSENGAQICDSHGCQVGISITYNGNTVAGAGSTIVD